MLKCSGAQNEPDAQLAVLLDFLMRVSPQIHPCLQSPGLAHDSLCVAAELPVAQESITDCLNSHVILLVQGSSLDQISDIQSSVYTSRSARGTNSVDRVICCWRRPQWWATQWTPLLWSGSIFSWLNKSFILEMFVWSITGWPLKWPLCYLWTSMVLDKSTR